MFYVNIFTGKTMKINKKSWKQLKIYGDFSNREICISLLDNYMMGSEDQDDFSLIYFNNKDQKKVEMILNEKKIIKNWMWNDIVEKNWNKKCKDFFKPVTINNKIQIIPFWEETNQDYLTIKINPALAFGTGHHETTYMMIQAILDLNLGNMSAIDIGTGSGILSILLRKMGIMKILAIDNDSLVESNFYENLKLNNIKDINFKIIDCCKIKEFDHDVILANINREVLIKLIQKLKNNKSLIVLSGILIEDEPVIESVLLNNNKKVLKKYRKNEWSCIIAE